MKIDWLTCVLKILLEFLFATKKAELGQFSWLVGFSAQIVKCKTTHEYECVLLYVEQNMKWVETF